MKTYGDPEFVRDVEISRAFDYGVSVNPGWVELGILIDEAAKYRTGFLSYRMRPEHLERIAAALSEAAARARELPVPLSTGDEVRVP